MMGDPLKKLEKFSDKAGEWVATEFKFLDELKGAILKKDIVSAEKFYEHVGRAERQVMRFLKKLSKQMEKLMEILPETSRKNLKLLVDSLKLYSENILKFTSRYEGSLKEVLSQLSLKYKLVEKAKGRAKLKVEQDINALWNQLNRSTKEVIRWTNALQVKLLELDMVKKGLRKLKQFS